MVDHSPNAQHWCFAWYPEPPPTTATERAAFEKKYIWPRAATIRIGFMGGTEAQQALVMKYAEGWIAMGRANLTFKEVTDGSADIRISFIPGGSWSMIGTSCKDIPKTDATMNFGWLTPDVDEAEAKRVILHEFGHALGLIHEHQNPRGSISWDENAVKADLQSPPNSWSDETIERNMFKAYSKWEVHATALDNDSIMMYPIPRHWVVDAKDVAGQNDDLSAKDKSLARKIYP